MDCDVANAGSQLEDVCKPGEQVPCVGASRIQIAQRGDGDNIHVLKRVTGRCVAKNQMHTLVVRGVVAVARHGCTASRLKRDRY